jgi:iron complex transport system substrate-binding protein
LPIAATSEGSAAIRTGSLAYPREAIDSDNMRVRIPRPAHRIVSQYWSIDDYVYSVAPPESIVAVSQSAYARSYSNVYLLAEKFRPAIATDPERVLDLNPDLILVSSDGRGDYTSLVRSTGVPVYRMQSTFHTLDQVKKTILLTGYLIGEDAAAQKVAAQFQARIDEGRAKGQAARARGMAPLHILALAGRHGYGARTLLDDVLRTVGAINVAAEHGLDGYAPINFEQIAQWSPDWILAGADRGQTKLVLQQLLADPAVAVTKAARDHHILVLESDIVQPMSPFSARFVTTLADALYGAQRARTPRRQTREEPANSLGGAFSPCPSCARSSRAGE